MHQHAADRCYKSTRRGEESVEAGATSAGWRAPQPRTWLSGRVKARSRRSSRRPSERAAKKPNPQTPNPHPTSKKGTRARNRPKPPGLRVGHVPTLLLQRLLALVLSVVVGADDCTQTLKTKCPLPFKSCNDRLTCTRDCCGTRLHDSPDLVCKPKERKAYCNSTAPPTPSSPTPSPPGPSPSASTPSPSPPSPSGTHGKYLVFEDWGGRS
jgi:hypothetical protein